MMEKRKSGKIVSMVNHKGGVGKTTTACSIAAGLATEGRRVLLVDLDAQGSASLSLGIPRAELRPGAAEVIFEGLPVHRAIRQVEGDGLYIMPGGMGLTSADLILADVKGRERILRGILDPLRADFDVIVLDNAPSLGLLTVNALTASDGFVIPVTPDYLALEGLVNLLDAVGRIRHGIGHVAALWGILLTLCDYRLTATREIIELIRGHYGRQVFQTEVPGNVRLKEAPSFGRSIFGFAPSSTGAEAYRRLVIELAPMIEFHHAGIQE